MRQCQLIPLIVWLPVIKNERPHKGGLPIFGAPGEIRTPDRLVRRRVRHEPFSFESVS